MKKIILFLIVIVIIGGVAFAVFKTKVQAPIQEESPTQQVPVETIQESNKAKLNEKILQNGIYITPLRVVSDSRCPEDVQCIWAGSVKLDVKLESKATKETKEFGLTSGVGMTFLGKKITLEDVSPAKNSEVQISPAMYVFTFSVEGIDLYYNENIDVISPVQYGLVTSPFSVIGQAKTWYFEGSFPVRLEDANGKVLATVPATAEGDWMTTNFVPFKAVLTFSTPTTKSGKLILSKDNPSDIREFDQWIEIPVTFSQ